MRVITEGAAGSVLRPLVGAAAVAAPKPLLRSVLKAGGVTEPTAAAALARLFDGSRDAVYDNCLSLAREEARVILHPADEPSPAALGPKRSFLLWTDNDTWCTKESVVAIREAFGDLEVEHATAAGTLPHAFSVDPSHFAHVSRCVAAWVTASYRDQDFSGERC